MKSISKILNLVIKRRNWLTDTSATVFTEEITARTRNSRSGCRFSCCRRTGGSRWRGIGFRHTSVTAPFINARFRLQIAVILALTAFVNILTTNKRKTIWLKIKFWIDWKWVDQLSCGLAVISSYDSIWHWSCTNDTLTGAIAPWKTVTGRTAAATRSRNRFDCCCCCSCWRCAWFLSGWPR